MSSVKERSSHRKYYASATRFDAVYDIIVNDFHIAVSDEGSHDKHSKKELLGGKRKDKKDRKDRGYATLEGESSPDEDQETK